MTINYASAGTPVITADGRIGILLDDVDPYCRDHLDDGDCTHAGGCPTDPSIPVWFETGPELCDPHDVRELAEVVQEVLAKYLLATAR